METIRKSQMPFSFLSFQKKDNTKEDLDLWGLELSHSSFTYKPNRGDRKIKEKYEW